MGKLRNVTVSEDVWARLKQRALDERVTLREVVERSAHQYLAVGDSAALERKPIGPSVPSVHANGSVVYASGFAVPRHWVKDDEPA